MNNRVLRQAIVKGEKSVFELLANHKRIRTLTACLLLCAMLLSACGAPAPAALTAEESKPPEEAAATVAESWNGDAYLGIKEWAWEDIQDYYENL